jgi:hypothetical protein
MMEMTAHAPTPAGELSSSKQASGAVAEIQAGVFMAKQFPRDERLAFDKIQQSLSMSPVLVARATYEYPRGGSQVKGISIYLARELGRVWGNLRHGWFVAYSDERMTLFRAYSWDLETNNYISYDAVVNHRAQRRGGPNEVTQWKDLTDERDIRELVSNIGARVERQTILHQLPDWMKDQVVSVAERIEAENDRKNPADALKSLAESFQKFGVTEQMLVDYVGVPLAKFSGAQLTHLRQVWKGINLGEYTWTEFSRIKREEKDRAAREEADRQAAAHAAKVKAQSAPTEPPPLSEDLSGPPPELKPREGPPGLKPEDFNSEEMAKVKTYLSGARGFRTMAQVIDWLRRYEGDVESCLLQLEREYNAQQAQLRKEQRS